MKSRWQWCILLALVAVGTLISPSAQARVRQPGHIGLGLGFGTLATGVSGKYFFDSQTSLQLTAGVWRSRLYCNRYGSCWGGGSSGALSADYLFEQRIFAGDSRIAFAWEAGLGGAIGFNDHWRNDFAMAASGILGLEVLLDVIPLDLVFEWRPSFYVRPGLSFDPLNFGGHIRFYF